MGLPSISSTVSISDNVDLRDYYDNLLFKNKSGKSLTDLPNKQFKNSKINNNSSGSNKNNTPSNFDFINGFRNSLTISTASNQNDNINNTIKEKHGHTPSHNTRGGVASFQLEVHDHNQNIPYQDDVINAEPLNLPTGSLLHNISYSGVKINNQHNQDALSSFWSHINNGYSDYDNNKRRSSATTNDVNDHQLPTYLRQSNIHYNLQQSQQAITTIAGDRRSSYISDSLINDPSKHWTNNQQYNNNTNGNNNGNTTYRAPNSYNSRSQPNQSYQFVNVNGNSTLNNQNNNNNYRPGYIQNQNMKPQQYKNYTMNMPNNQTTHHYDATTERNKYSKNASQDGNTSNGLEIDNGLLLINGKDIVSSDELHRLYENCGLNYFSSNAVYSFVDYIKSLINISGSESENLNNEDNKITKEVISNFLVFLNNCNLNFGSQLISKEITNEKKDNGDQSSTLNSDGHKMINSSLNYIQGKPLVLVALKNGKLELLSTPQNTNLVLKRGDLVIIDGDRGKDLVQVIEPSVDLNLALFTNFLKKKVHFDSLITSKSQHYPNSEFIKTLINSKNGTGEKLNPKLYDVIELTQLIIPSKQILRFATPWEVSTNLQNKFQDELKALHIAQLKLESLNESRMNSSENDDSMGSNFNKKTLNIKILNAEFQFDRKKLTFYYICEERNDFRALIKELFKFYKTRIWLCAIPNNLNIDSKYYDCQRKEVKIYEQLMENQNTKGDNGLIDLKSSIMSSGLNGTTQRTNLLNSNKDSCALPLNQIELDDFQIGVYKELVRELF